MTSPLLSDRGKLQVSLLRGFGGVNHVQRHALRNPIANNPTSLRVPAGDRQLLQQVFHCSAPLDFAVSQRTEALALL